MTLNKPIVGMASTADGGGYWLVASDGGIFSFGDAQFYGSTGSMGVTSPITTMVPSADGKGYAIFTQSGGAYTFGDASTGSGGSAASSGPVVSSTVAL
jgi:hypothetical protein